MRKFAFVITGQAGVHTVWVEAGTADKARDALVGLAVEDVERDAAADRA